MGALPNICSAPACLDAARRWDGRTPLVPTASLVVAPPAVGGAGAPPAPAAAPAAVAPVDRRPWHTLPDLELFHKLVESGQRSGSGASGFISLIGARRAPGSTVYTPGDDTITTILFPFIIKMERMGLVAQAMPLLRTSAEREKQGAEKAKLLSGIKEVEAAMFAELARQFDPVYHPPTNASWGGVPDPMGAIRDRLLPYRTHVYEKEKARKAAEAAAEVKARAEAERVRAIEELGEISLIGRTHYIVKDGDVFAMNHPIGQNLYIVRDGAVFERNPRPVRHHPSVIPPPARPLPADLSLFLLRLTAAEIRALRGARVFSSTNEAEAHWTAVDDAEIIAEARRRLAEEQRVAAAADAAAAREARILTAMQNIRV
jgi:hypothetical protein